MAGSTNSFDVLGIDHVVFRVSDLDRSIAFYGKALGLRPERVVAGFLCQMRCGRNLLDLMQLPEGAELAESPSRGNDHLCLNVTGDINVVIEHLTNNGIAIAGGPTELYGATGYGTSVYFLDPDGHKIELKTAHIEYPIGLTLETAGNLVTRPKD